MSLAFLLIAASAHAQLQRPGQVACINALNKGGAKVAATQGKANTACIKNAGKGKEPDPGGCLTRDDGGKLAAAANKLDADFEKSCAAETPDFGVPGVSAGTAAVVAATAAAEEIALVDDIFGPLSGAITTDPAVAACQAAVSKGYEKIAATAAKAFLGCKKAALGTALDREPLESCLESLPDDAKVDKAIAKLEADVGKRCAGIDLGSAFPGTCGSADDFASCISERVLCRACRIFNHTDDLFVDCDIMDDDGFNFSCLNRTYVVTKTADTFDGRCDDDCSLREAIFAAGDSIGPNEVIIPAGKYVLTLLGDGPKGGNLDVSSGSQVLRGAGAGLTVIDGNATGGVLETYDHVIVRISGVTIQNGFAPFAGGIRNGGSLSLVDSTVSGNSAARFGGGIFNFSFSSISIANCSVSGNSAGEFGGGIENLEATTMTITNSTVSGNSAGEFGGGIDNSGTMTITNSTVSGNSAQFGGGGVEQFEGTMTITNSTVSGNSAVGYGGGIEHLKGTMTIINSTVSGNSAQFGGGIEDDSAAMTIINSTVSGNSAGESGGGIHNLADGFYVTVSSSIVAANAPDNCNFPLDSSGHNLSDDDTCELTHAADLQNVTPALGPLADNGGPTQTHALLTSSPAIDAGDDAVCPATDQRGAPRPQGAACDIGAFEADGEPLMCDDSEFPFQCNGNCYGCYADYLHCCPVSGEPRFCCPPHEICNAITGECE